MTSSLRRTIHFLTLTGMMATAAAPAATRAAEPGGAAPLLAQAPGDSGEKSKPKAFGSKAKTPLKPAAPKPAAGTAAGEAPPAPAGEATAGPTLVQRAVSFIKTYPLWIVGGLGAILLILLGWALLSARARPAGKDPFAELGFGEGSEDPAAQRRFSSTKIQAADVKDRLAGAVKTTEVETDREYALVVDEEALKMPPLPEEEASRAGSASLEKLLAENDAEAAYAEYARRLQSDPKAEFDPALERSLSEHLIRSRKLAEAARVLEHHVRTHGAEEIHPDCYFNLGYIHFMQKTLKKSSRFLKLFVKVEKNPAHVERAMKILRRIESSGGVG